MLLKCVATRVYHLAFREGQEVGANRIQGLLRESLQDQSMIAYTGTKNQVPSLSGHDPGDLQLLYWGMHFFVDGQNSLWFRL